MNAPVKLAAFAVALAAVFAAAFGIGRAVGPIHDDPPAATVEHGGPHG